MDEWVGRREGRRETRSCLWEFYIRQYVCTCRYNDSSHYVLDVEIKF